MNIESTDFSIQEVENNAICFEFWLKNHEKLGINCTLENGEFKFRPVFTDDQKIFSKWLRSEQDIYKTFILNYINEIKKLDQIQTFEGEIVEEYSVIIFGEVRYIVIIKCHGISSTLRFELFPNSNFFTLVYQVPLPINSEGNYAQAVPIEDILKEETIKCIWDPLRGKTKYRLELLNMLR